jgi:hypothetical protein
MSRFIRENWILIAVSLTAALIGVAWLLLHSESPGGVYPIY